MDIYMFDDSGRGPASGLSADSEAGPRVEYPAVSFCSSLVAEQRQFESFRTSPIVRYGPRITRCP
eukprot:767283-Hanusia_phi.AAC.1